MQSSRPYGIKGVTDNARPPVIVKAKIGRKNDKGYPEKLDYISFVEPGEEGTPCPAFEVLGTRPQSFLGAFPSDETETFVDAAWKRYGKSGLKCRGDGEIGVDRETGEELQCAGEYSKDNPETHLCPHARPTEKTVNGVLKKYPPECKPTLSMRLVVPLAGSMGLVQLDTGGQGLLQSNATVFGPGVEHVLDPVGVGGHGGEQTLGTDKRLDTVVAEDAAKVEPLARLATAGLGLADGLEVQTIGGPFQTWLVLLP